MAKSDSPLSKTVRICGSAPNLQEMPDLPEGYELWFANNPKPIRKFVADPIFNQYTRWFNLHSRYHMEWTYPKGFIWYLGQDGTKPFYTQKFWPDIPGCTEFPHKQIQAAFPEAARYHVCSITWMTALAIYEGFERIEFYGLMLRDKPDRSNECYKFERPCFFYWVNEAKKRGIRVSFPEEVRQYGDTQAGDPSTYTGELYGYETKPEMGKAPLIYYGLVRQIVRGDLPLRGNVQPKDFDTGV